MGSIRRTRPTKVVGGHQFRQVDAGYEHTCAVTTEFRAWCWGSNAVGQLGAGRAPGTNSTRPVAVAGGLFFAQLSAGASHGCAKTGAGAGYCWGDNSHAALGNGSSGPSTSTIAPGPVSAPR